MKKNLKNIKYFPIKDVKKIAALHQTKFYKRVAEEGKDKNGKQFPQYSKGYKEALERDMRIKRGSRKGQRHKGLGGISLETSSSKISKRILRLRGRTMSNFRVRDVKTDEYQLGWDGEAGAIIEYNADKGRNVVGLPNKEFDWIVNLFGKSFDRQTTKVKNINITVG